MLDILSNCNIYILENVKKLVLVLWPVTFLLSWVTGIFERQMKIRNILQRGEEVHLTIGLINHHIVDRGHGKKSFWIKYQGTPGKNNLFFEYSNNIYIMLYRSPKSNSRRKRSLSPKESAYTTSRREQYDRSRDGEKRRYVRSSRSRSSSPRESRKSNKSKLKLVDY